MRNVHLIIAHHRQCYVLFLLTQRVDLGCVSVYCCLWQTCSVTNLQLQLLWAQTKRLSAMGKGRQNCTDLTLPAKKSEPGDEVNQKTYSIMPETMSAMNLVQQQVNWTRMAACIPKLLLRGMSNSFTNRVWYRVISKLHILFPRNSSHCGMICFKSLFDATSTYT